MLKKLILISLVTISFISFSSASILSRDLLQSAIYQSDYSDKLFQLKYDDYNKKSYVCDNNKASCSLVYDLFQIKYDKDVSYICDGSKASCSSVYDLFQIKDGYVCPGKDWTCNQSNSIQTPSLIPIESIISAIEGDISSYTCKGDTVNCSDIYDYLQIKKDDKEDLYYICNGDDVNCSSIYDLVQIKKDGDNYYICDGDEVNCSSIYDFIQIKKDSRKDTYYMCNGDEVNCSYIYDFMQIKKDGDVYYMCNGDEVNCSYIYDFIQIKKDGDVYYMCDGDEVDCSSTYALTKTKRTSSNITDNMSDEELDKWLDDLMKDNTNTPSQDQSTTIPSFTMSDVISWMYSMGLTSKSNLTDFLPNDYLTREQASKFFVEFAKKVKGTENNNTTQKVSFTDIGNADKTLKSYIIEANQMGIINGYKGKFSPFNKLTKAQALAMLMRITDGKADETYNPRYNQYYLKAKSYGIITDSFGTNLDNENIKRGDIALLFYSMKFWIK